MYMFYFFTLETYDKVQSSVRKSHTCCAVLWRANRILLTLTFCIITSWWFLPILKAIVTYKMKHKPGIRVKKTLRNFKLCTIYKRKINYFQSISGSGRFECPWTSADLCWPSFIWGEVTCWVIWKQWRLKLFITAQLLI